MYNRPLPIGYLELQKSWLAGDYPRLEDGLTEKLAECHREATGPGHTSNGQMVYLSSRIQVVKDGAGVAHYTLFAGYAPKETSSEPLDPRNLNDTTHVTNPVNDLSIGMKEQKF